MVREHPFVRKLFSAKLAAKRFYFRMDQQVGLQVANFFELLAAFQALEDAHSSSRGRVQAHKH